MVSGIFKTLRPSDVIKAFDQHSFHVPLATVLCFKRTSPRRSAGLHPPQQARVAAPVLRGGCGAARGFRGGGEERGSTGVLENWARSREKTGQVRRKRGVGYGHEKQCLDMFQI